MQLHISTIYTQCTNLRIFMYKLVSYIAKYFSKSILNSQIYIFFYPMLPLFLIHYTPLMIILPFAPL